MFVFQSVTSFFPTFLVDYRGYSSVFASVVFGAVFLLSAASLPALGRLGDMFSSDGALVFAFGITATGLLVFVLVGGTASLIAGTALIGIGFSWGRVLQSRVIDALPDGDERHGFGLFRTAYMLLGSTGSVTTGVLVGILGWAGAITVNVGTLGVGIAALLANRVFDRGL